MIPGRRRRQGRFAGSAIIGPGATHAEFCLESVVELRKILRGMAATSLKDSRTRRR